MTGYVEPAPAWIDLLLSSTDHCQLEERIGSTTVKEGRKLLVGANSTRLRRRDGNLFMKLEVFQQAGGHVRLAPFEIIYGQDGLVTLHPGPIDVVSRIRREAWDLQMGSTTALILLLYGFAEDAGFRLNEMADQLQTMSQNIFAARRKDGLQRRVGRETRRLRQLMIDIGSASERLVVIRQAFLAIDEIAAFLESHAEPALLPGDFERLQDVRRDIRSLEQLESSLSSKIQLLLDAATGFISIEQNEVAKVLTVASVAGVPPVLIAGIYGMNFKNMPELDWSWGYPSCLLAISFSIAIPILWFRWREWL